VNADLEIHQFLRLKSIVQKQPDLKLFVSPEFLSYVRTRLNVSKVTTLAGRGVPDEFVIDGVLVHLARVSFVPFYLYY
jgi:hypothetical protein